MNSYSTSWWSLLLINRPREDERLSWPCNSMPHKLSVPQPSNLLQRLVTKMAYYALNAWALTWSRHTSLWLCCTHFNKTTHMHMLYASTLNNLPAGCKTEVRFVVKYYESVVKRFIYRIIICIQYEYRYHIDLFKIPGWWKHWQVFSIGTVAAYSSKYSALVAYKILELFKY